MGNIKVTATGKFRMNLSLHHMMAACRFATIIDEIETQHHGEELGPFYDDIVMNAYYYVIMAVASLEAFINEDFRSPEENFREVAKDFMEEMWELIEKKTILEKFGLA